MLTYETQPLNHSLYTRLQERFGEVRIASQGEAIRYSTTKKLLDSRTVQGASRVQKSNSCWHGEISKDDIEHSGEYYRVNCPKCGDTRFRLWINHMVHKHPWMVVCYNEIERCYPNQLAIDSLLMHIFKTRPPKNLPIRKGTQEGGRVGPVGWPGTCTPLHDLPFTHPANDYLAGRGYDPHYLSREYGLRYCESSMEYPVCARRIVVPIHMGGEMVGWQARFVGERNWKVCTAPKYWDLPGMAKRLMFYNHDRAAQYPWVALEEGITDVWSTGPMAMGLLGGTLTFGQRRILAFPPFMHKPIAVMLDADAADENQAIVEELRREHRAGVVLVNLPADTDPGNFDIDTNLEMIYEAAEQQGVQLA